MRYSALLIGIASFFLVASQVLVPRAVADQTCHPSRDDQKIAASTDVIESFWSSANSRAIAYNNRGVAFAAKCDFDHAIGDYIDAIRLDPKYTYAHYNLGNAYRAKGDVDRAITEYTDAIWLDPKDADAHNNRGLTYQTKGDLDHATADYAEAIRLEPKSDYAYMNLGAVYAISGDPDRAIADYTEAIRLDPKYALAYRRRGIAHLYSGVPAKALADVSKADELVPGNAYNALWRDIVGQRNNVPSQLSQAITKIDMTAWPAPIVRMFLGQITPANVSTAADDPEPKKKGDQSCEANFYSGELALRQGAKDEATRLFRLAASDCPRNFSEWNVANAELKALGVAQ
jgi:lipoprotein NlpI